MARGTSRANSEGVTIPRNWSETRMAQLAAAGNGPIKDIPAAEAKALEPGRDPMRALNHTASLFDVKPLAFAKDFELEDFNRQQADAKERLMKVKDVLEASKNNKDFFEKLGEASENTVEGNWSIERGLLYNGTLDGKERAEQFLQSVKEGLKEGSFGDDFRGAKVTFKGARKDEVRIDFPAGTELGRRSDLRSAIRSLGSAMTSTRTDPGDGFGHTTMPKVTFRVGGEEIDTIDFM